MPAGGAEPTSIVDTISALFWRLGTTGIAEWVDGPGGGYTLTAGFETEKAARAAADTLGRDRTIGSAGEAIVVGVEPVATHGWVDPDRRGRLELPSATIDLVVGPAFGHGDHPTTRLALDLLLATIPPTAAVLDFGTGTGILGVAAAASGATIVVAVDDDPDALAVAARNLADHPGEAAITVTDELPDPAMTGPGFDVIVANVLLGVHRDHGPLLTSLLAPGGSMIVSGVLAGQRAATIEAYPGLSIADEVEDRASSASSSAGDRWLALRLTAAGDASRDQGPATSRSTRTRLRARIQ